MDTIVLLCCTGRSGSTTLLRLINTIPNSNICGENGGCINHLMNFYRSIKKTNTFVIGKKNPIPYSKYISSGIKPCWYNSYNYDVVIDNLKKLIINLFKKDPSVTLWGFKEIRYFDTIDLIEDFKELFPNTKIIVHIKKDIEKQSQSAWWINDPSSLNHLSEYNSKLISFYEKHKDYVYLSTFENMFDLNNIKKMFDFIGHSDNFDVKKINTVLSNKME